MTDKTLTTTSASSAARVQDFRHRMAEHFSRVEGFVLSAENAGISRVMVEQGVTKDVAVAGLVRLGLSVYESARTEQPPGATICLNQLAASAGLRYAEARSGRVETVSALAASTPSGQVNAVASSAIVGSSTDAIASFFKTRKEILDEPK